jgi:hypothetical protein
MTGILSETSPAEANDRIEISTDAASSNEESNHHVNIGVQGKASAEVHLDRYTKVRRGYQHYQ